MGAQLVDAIVADLSVKYEQYVAGFNKATAAHERFTKSVPKIGAMGGFTQAEAQQYADRHTKVGAAAEQSGEKRKRAAKGASDVEKAEAKAATDAVKKAAREREQAERAAAKASEAAVKAVEREKQAALKATQLEQQKAAKAAAAKAEAERIASAAAVAAAEREAAARARLAEVAQRAVDRRAGGIAPAVGGRIGATVPREATSQRSIPINVLNGDARAEVEAEKEINHLLADQAVLSSRLGILKGRERDYIRDQVSELRLVRQLERAGLDDAAIALRLEERRALIARQRQIDERKQSAQGVSKFARGAGIGGIGAGSAATVAGVTLAAGIGISAAVVQSAADYARELKNVSEQIGLTTQQTQVYEAEARRLGVSQNELRNGLGQFADYLGRAKSGGEDQIKTFTALGLSVKDFATAGDALPAVIDRISSIPDAAKRAAVETRLFGEEGRKLDALLSGGNERINDLAEAMLKAGTILSAGDIARLGEVSKELARVKAQLQVSYASIVADNADSIIALANSFGRLINDIREAVRWIQTFNSQKLNDLTEGKPLAPSFIANSQTAWEQLLGPYISGIPSQFGSAAPQQDVMNGEARAFLASIKGTAVPPGTVNNTLLDRLNAPKPTKGPKGKSADTLANEADQRTRRFNDEIARYEDERLSAVADQTSDENVRRQLQREQIDRESARAAEDIRLRAQEDIRKGADARLTNARRDQAIAAERAASDERILVINLGDTLSTLQRRAAAETDVLTFADDILRAQRDLATTTEQRRDIDKKLLENALQRESVGANLVLRRAEEGDPSVTRQDVEAANRTIATQPGRKAVQQRQIDRANESPLDAYKRQLHEATDDTNEALQSIEVNALQALEDSVSRSIGKVLGLKGAFGDLVGSVLTDIARLELKKGILSLLNSGDGGGGSGGIIATIGRAIGGSGARASGGNIVGGSTYLVGERGPELVTMGASGRVYPNGSLPSFAGGGNNGAGNTVHQYFNLDNRYGITTPELIDYVNQTAKSEGRRGAGAAVVANARATPGTLAQYDKLEG